MNDPAIPSADGNPLAALYGKLPRGWEAWRGMGGILYARRRRPAPAVVLRAATAGELAAKVAGYKAGLDGLRREFPSWEFEQQQLGAGRSHILAFRGDDTISAWDAAGMAGAIRDYEAGR